MLKQGLLTRSFMLLCMISLPLLSKGQLKNWDTSPEKMIPREWVAHKILSDELKEFIVQYDEMYAKYSPDSQGIILWCNITDKEISYTVGYLSSFGYRGLIVCEPVNGKDVTLSLDVLAKQIELPHYNSVELLKNSIPDLYQRYEEGQKEIDEYECLHSKGAEYRVMVTSDFVSWQIIFDRQSGKVLKRIKPDWTKEYDKMFKNRQ